MAADAVPVDDDPAVCPVEHAAGSREPRQRDQGPRPPDPLRYVQQTINASEHIPPSSKHSHLVEQVLGRDTEDASDPGHLERNEHELPASKERFESAREAGAEPASCLGFDVVHAGSARG